MQSHQQRKNPHAPWILVSIVALCVGAFLGSVWFSNGSSEAGASSHDSAHPAPVPTETTYETDWSKLRVEAGSSGTSPGLVPPDVNPSVIETATATPSPSNADYSALLREEEPSIATESPAAETEPRTAEDASTSTDGETTATVTATPSPSVVTHTEQAPAPSPSDTAPAETTTAETPTFSMSVDDHQQWLKDAVEARLAHYSCQDYEVEFDSEAAPVLQGGQTIVLDPEQLEHLMADALFYCALDAVGDEPTVDATVPQRYLETADGELAAGAYCLSRSWLADTPEGCA